MNKSHYFEELSSAYSAEIDDLTSDFEGKTVLTARLKEKRREIDFMLQMIDSAPEMVAPIFYGAFTFLRPAVMIHAVQAEPDDADFPEWEVLSDSIGLSDWAQPMAELVLAEPGGDRFMVSAAAVEFLRLRELATPEAATAPAESANKDNGDDDEDQDLAEAGAEWMSQQGFDAQTS